MTSGIRIGTPAVTTRDMGPEEMKKIAGFIVRIIREGDEAVDAVRDDVLNLLKDFPLYPNL